MTFIAIRSALVTVITPVKNAAVVAEIYNYMPKNLPETPAIAIIDAPSGEVYSNTGENLLEIKYIIRCMVEDIKTSETSTQITTLLTVVDAVLAELRKVANASLESTSIYFMFENITETQEGVLEDITVLYKDIIITAHMFKSI